MIAKKWNVTCKWICGMQSTSFMTKMNPYYILVLKIALISKTRSISKYVGQVHCEKIQSKWEMTGKLKTQKRIESVSLTVWTEKRSKSPGYPISKYSTGKWWKQRYLTTSSLYVRFVLKVWVAVFLAALARDEDWHLEDFTHYPGLLKLNWFLTWVVVLEFWLRWL